MSNVYNENHLENSKRSILTVLKYLLTLNMFYVIVAIRYIAHKGGDYFF